MNYRIILMMSGLLMMFSVYGYIMMIGAIVGENDAVFGNAVMGTVFAVLTFSVFQFAMRKRKQAHRLFAETIESMMKTDGCVEASNFASVIGVSIDDARDILDKQMIMQHWRREEKSEYNALYYESK
jgi:divalent metal cation (Fe/Co/Zn/Cd) transporter